MLSKMIRRTHMYLSFISGLHTRGGVDLDGYWDPVWAALAAGAVCFRLLSQGSERRCPDALDGVELLAAA